MKKTVILNILFVFLTLIIITVAALSALAVGGILKTSYGEKTYDAEKVNDPTASGMDNSLTLNPWGIYEEDFPTIGETLDTNPEYLITNIYKYEENRLDEYGIDNSERAHEILDSNRGLLILIRLCDSFFYYTAPPVDYPFADSDSMYEFLTKEVQFSYNNGTFFINDYRYTDKDGNSYALKAAATYNNVYYFRILPEKSSTLSINTADYISHHVTKWISDMVNIADFFEIPMDDYTGEIPDVTIPESPIKDFCYTIYPALIDLQDSDYFVFGDYDVYNIIGGFRDSFNRFYFYTAAYENQLLIVFPPADLTNPSEKLILFYDPVLAKISGFALTMYNY